MGAALPAAFMAATILQGVSQISAGQSANSALKYRANQQEIAGTQAMASSQRTAAEETRKADYVGSRARAVAAASGAGATDPTVISLESQIAGQGDYNALSALYAGTEAKRVGSANAALSRYEGNAEQTAGYIKAGSTLLSGGSSLFDKYGGGGLDTGNYQVGNDFTGAGDSRYA